MNYSVELKQQIDNDNDKSQPPIMLEHRLNNLKHALACKNDARRRG